MTNRSQPRSLAPEYRHINSWELTIWTHMLGHGAANFTIQAVHHEHETITRSGLIRDNVLNQVVAAMPKETAQCSSHHPM